MDVAFLSSKPDLRASRRYLRYPLPARLSSRADGIEGVSYEEGMLLFDRRLHTEETARLVVLRAEGQPLAVRFQGQGKAATVTSEDLQAINEHHSSVELSADEIVVFERYSANDQLMRSPLKFTRRALEKFAQDFTQGRGLHLDHRDDRGFGRVFAATVEEATIRGITGSWLITRSYAVKMNVTAERLQLIRDVETGVLGYDSITFLSGQWTFHEVETPEEEAENLFFFEVDDDPNQHPRLEALELSVLSILGNVYGAGDNKPSLSIADADPAKLAPAPSSAPPKPTVICLW